MPQQSIFPLVFSLFVFWLLQNCKFQKKSELQILNDGYKGWEEILGEDDRENVPFTFKKASLELILESTWSFQKLIFDQFERNKYIKL